MNFPFLTLLIFIPIVGALFILLFSKEGTSFNQRNSFNMAFWISVATCLISIFMCYSFDFSQKTGFQFYQEKIFISSLNMGYRVGVDGLSLLMILMTSILMPLCLLYSKKILEKKVKAYLISFLLLESFIMGVFVSLDILLFYFFFELTLVPMFLIIGIWGGKDRIYASYKFFLYTFAGSVFFLLGIVAIIGYLETTDMMLITKTLQNTVPDNIERLLWLSLFIAFAIKIPMFPVHSWLPVAHVQAPTEGSMILAAILLKMGGYGFLRLSLPMLPDASLYFQELVFIISVIAIIYTSIVAFMQKDMKRLIAYSSIAHMGYVTLGIFTLNNIGVQGAVFQMISHAIISAGLFLSVGVIYQRLQTKEIAMIKGLANVMPKFSILFVILVLGSVALPSTSGFVGEFLILLATYKVSISYMILASLGIVLGAIYMLWLTKRIIMGQIVNNNIKEILDLDKTELFILTFFAVLIILFGIYPSLITDVIKGAINNIII